MVILLSGRHFSCLDTICCILTPKLFCFSVSIYMSSKRSDSSDCEKLYLTLDKICCNSITHELFSVFSWYDSITVQRCWHCWKYHSRWNRTLCYGTEWYNNKDKRETTSFYNHLFLFCVYQKNNNKNNELEYENDVNNSINDIVEHPPKMTIQENQKKKSFFSWKKWKEEWNEKNIIQKIVYLLINVVTLPLILTVPESKRWNRFISSVISFGFCRTFWVHIRLTLGSLQSLYPFFLLGQLWQFLVGSQKQPQSAVLKFPFGFSLRLAASFSAVAFTSQRIPHIHPFMHLFSLCGPF